MARFTRKFLIPKGFHTIRNKKMRAEKLFFSFDTGLRTLLDLVVTPGNGRLARISAKLLGALRARCRRQPLRVLLDAGAAHSHRELLALTDQNPNQVLLVRAPRRTSYLERWKALPEQSFTSYEEPGRYKGAPAKRIHVTETTTLIRADKSSPQRRVRTLVAREEKRRGKDRWHALFIFRDNATPPLTLIQQFRARQHHEQTYRILLHDAFVDTVPSGYYKKSPNPDRPGFRRNATTLYGAAQRPQGAPPLDGRAPPPLLPGGAAPSEGGTLILALARPQEPARAHQPRHGLMPSSRWVLGCTAVPRITFPSSFQRHVPCPPEPVGGSTVREALEQYFSRHPQVRGYVLDEQGALRQHVVIFVNGAQVRDRAAQEDPIDDGAEIYVMQALSGG